jgi:hypothetical protein
VADSGVLFNTVTASSNEAPDAMANLSIPIVQDPSMTVEKSSATTSLNAPATVTYDYLVTNDGNVGLTGISLSDDNDNDDASCLATTLAPAATTTCTATHTFTQAELDADGSPVADSRELFNNVTASSNEAPDAFADLSIPIERVPSISMVKSSATTEIDSPQVVTYDYLVTNTGNVALTGIYIDDDNDEDDASCVDTELAPGASTTCTATHDVDDAEFAAYGSPVAGSGALVNNATAWGTAPGGDVSADDSLSIAFAELVARFTVTKDFTDDNPSGVMVYIDCDTGLPLQQDFEIFDAVDSEVTFVVNSYLPGTMECTIIEEPVPDGYTGSYVAGPGPSGVAGSIAGGDTACVFSAVIGGTFTCEITNAANSATFRVYKDWVIFNNGGDEVYEKAAVTIMCDRLIQDGDYNSDLDYWYKSGNLGDGQYLSATVDTIGGPATCWATEQINQSGVESTDDCYSREIAAGGSSECTFVNTVFFEGIPTLNQYGLALLALLMLGVGAVGFRRFV